MLPFLARITPLTLLTKGYEFLVQTNNEVVIIVGYNILVCGQASKWFVA